MKPEQPGYAFLPDMDDTRLLVDLTSHASNLSEASRALAQALESAEVSTLADSTRRPGVHPPVHTLQGLR